MQKERESLSAYMAQLQEERLAAEEQRVKLDKSSATIEAQVEEAQAMKAEATSARRQVEAQPRDVRRRHTGACGGLSPSERELAAARAFAPTFHLALPSRSQVEALAQQTASEAQKVAEKQRLLSDRSEEMNQEQRLAKVTPTHAHQRPTHPLLTHAPFTVDPPTHLFLLSSFFLTHDTPH